MVYVKGFAFDNHRPPLPAWRRSPPTTPLSQGTFKTKTPTADLHVCGVLDCLHVQVVAHRSASRCGISGCVISHFQARCVHVDDGPQIWCFFRKPGGIGQGTCWSGHVETHSHLSSLTSLQNEMNIYSLDLFQLAGPLVLAPFVMGRHQPTFWNTLGIIVVSLVVPKRCVTATQIRGPDFRRDTDRNHSQTVEKSPPHHDSIIESFQPRMRTLFRPAACKRNRRGKRGLKT